MSKIEKPLCEWIVAYSDMRGHNRLVAVNARDVKSAYTAARSRLVTKLGAQAKYCSITEATKRRTPKG